MIGAIVVTLVVFAIVGSYMAIVNRMLRSDEHWNESNIVRPAAQASSAGYSSLAASPAHA
jgi:hypothetical protein